jgi:predicted ATPase/DNA-binding CsgD family transcriptional regulator
MVAVNLPSQLTPFVGRNEDLDYIMNRLADPDCRLLTLAGQGGIGKTRLAMEAARLFDAEHGENNRNVYFVPLQGVGGPGCCVVPAIAESMGLSIYQGIDPKPQLLKALREQSLLLVLDNFEHLLDEAGLLSEILAAAPGVKILTTSREALNLQEEWLYVVQGMAYPKETPDNGTPLEAYSAVRLFLHHARRIRPGFSLDEEKEGILRICALVEGMPLGLELASTWVRSLSCMEIAREIERGIDFLETPSRNIAPRHQSMRAVLNQSWKLLSVTQRAVFRRLSVFRNGFTREAGEYVAGASLRTLSTLVDKSLLRRDHAGRYDLHDLIRQFAAEQLQAAPDDEQETRARHCGYYLQFLHDQWDQLKGWGQKESLLEIDANIENIRLAWDWAVAHECEAQIDGALHSLWFYYDTRGLYKEGEAAFDRAVKMLSAAAPHSLTLGRLMARQGSMCYSLNLNDRSESLYGQSLDILERYDARREMAFVLLKWSDISWRRNRFVQVVRYVRKSLELYRESGDEWGIAFALHWVGSSYVYLGRMVAGRDLVLESLTLDRQNGNRWGMAAALQTLSMAEWAIGNYAESRQYGEESLSISQDIGLHWCIALAHRSIAFAMYRLGEHEEATQHLCLALRASLDFQIIAFITQPMTGFVDLKLNEGRISEAVELLGLLHQHPANWFREETSEYLKRAKKLLPPEPFQLAFARGRLFDLDTAAKALLEEYDGSVNIEIVPAVRQVVQSLSEPLTERELEILRLVSDGLSNREIADQLVLAVSTVKWYTNQMYGKLGVNSRTQALARARELQLLS